MELLQPCTGKIAFCFLTYDEIIRYDIWNYFFRNCDSEKYTVFIHPKNMITYNDNYTFKYNIVKNIVNTTGKDNISIVHATIRLLKETYDCDKNSGDVSQNITHYIFLTQSCIPLYSFNYMYNIITQFPSSVISSIDNNKKDRYLQLSNTIRPYINYNNFVKQQPNMILIKNDVETLINKNYTEHFKNMQCPDEHYFINVLANILKKKIIKKQINFCNNDLRRTQALEFKIVNKIFIDKIRNNGFLFMRKISKNSIVDIEYLYGK